jgi:hypothetical protein
MPRTKGGGFDTAPATTPAGRVRSYPYLIPIITLDVQKQPVNGFGRHSASPPVPRGLTSGPAAGRTSPCPRLRLAVGGDPDVKLLIIDADATSSGCVQVIARGPS